MKKNIIKFTILLILLATLSISAAPPKKTKLGDFKIEKSAGV